MQRRSFLRCSIIAATAIPGLVSFTGCSGGGGGGSDTSAATGAASSADTQVLAISNAQTSNDIAQAQISSDSSLLLTGTTVAAAPALAGFMQAPALETPSALFQAFQNDNLKDDDNALTSSDLYFDQDTVWAQHLAANRLAYSQVNSQLTKLKASLRLYGYKQATAPQSGVVQVGTLQASALQASPTLDATISLLLSLVNNLHLLSLTSDVIVIFTSAIDGIKDKLTNSSLTTLVFNAIESILRWIQTKSLGNISFSTNTEIMTSMAKMSIAVISTLSIVGLENITNTSAAAAPARAAALSDDEQDELTAFLAANNVQSQLILTLSSFVQTVMTNIVASTTARAAALEGDVVDPTYVLTDADRALIASLRQQSFILAALGLVMKVLVTFYQSGLSTVTDADTLEGDAQTYSALFGSTIDESDTLLSAFLTNFDSLFPEATIITELLTALSTLEIPIDETALEISTDPADEDTNLTVATNATAFASTLANLSYNFSSNTAGLAATFATGMAGMAYTFSMKGMEYGYNFAMQGMEYGYLFASRGEEVGLMADRILWMAVQIGQMADRIGEMADRIVYTEQLIVYTEMLILDFGLLIYGGMKNITNLMLTGMAIVFDREWYTPAEDDQIVTVISDMTKQMLADMHVYQLAVLENQRVLRETTLGALEWIQGDY